MPLVPYYYQTDAINATIDFLFNDTGNGVLWLPTSAGKSMIQAEVAKRINNIAPEHKILCISDVTKLLGQNSNEMKVQWPEAKTSIYSASYKSKDHRGEVVFAGIQSIYKKASLFNNVSVIIIDEVHRASLSEGSMYKRFYDELKETNPHVRVIGMSGTPWTMAGTLEGTWICDKFIYEIKMKTLFDEGFLCPLITPKTSVQADLSRVRINSSGDFDEYEMSLVMDEDPLVREAISDAMKHAVDRHSILVFASSVNHAEHIKRILTEKGEYSEIIIGDTENAERERIIDKFDKMELRWLISVGVLSTGFSSKVVDCLVILRATRSSSLWLQLLGRALRLHLAKINSMILCFGGNVERFGKITSIGPPPTKEAQKQAKRTPFKKCGGCNKLVKYLASECPFCLTKFGGDITPNHGVEASTDDIIEGASSIKSVSVTNVTVDNHHSRVSKKNSLRVTYHCGIEKIHEYFHFEGAAYKRAEACKWWAEVSSCDLIDHCPKSLLTALAELKAHGFKKAKNITVDYEKVKVTSGANYMGHKILTREY